MTELPSSVHTISGSFARFAKGWGISLCLVAWQAAAQAPAAPETIDTSAPMAQALPPTASAKPALQTTSKLWEGLSARQKQALAPLGDQWDALTAQQKKKWLAISDTFLQLTDEEQVTMHGRMREWARLSAKDRNAARFNFNNTQALPVDVKRAQWEAYQSLSDLDKQKLSSGPQPPVKSAARTTLPTSSRLVTPPARPVDTPKVIPQVAPSRPVNPKTLLPKTGKP